MELFINKLISGIIQVLLFSFIPFIVWIIFYRKKENFFHWLGFRKIEQANIRSVLTFSFCILILFMVQGYFILKLLSSVNMATSEFLGLGVTGIPAVIVYAFIITSLSEEIFFRGFLLKRLSNRLGFLVGNIIQSTIFGILHGVMFFTFTSTINTIIIILFTGLIGFFMGYVNEKKANGSIVPSWVLHSFANLFTSCIMLFNLL